MLNLKCDIEITSKNGAKIRFDYVNDIVVATSCKNLTDTAVIRVPRKMAWKGRAITEFINRDDVVSIKIGYEEYGLETVFKGYISNVENSIPVVITCENEMRRFKMINVPAEKIEKFDLKEYIEKYGGVKVHTSDTLTFGGMDITEEMTLAQALDKIMQVYPYVRGYFQDGEFYAVLDPSRWGLDRKPIIFDPQRNMISDNLSYTRAEDVKIGIKAESILRDNTKLNAYAPEAAFDLKKGKDGSVTATIKNDYSQQQYYAPECTTQADLQAYADKMAAEVIVDSMSGTFTAFGVPFVRKADIVELRDIERKERHKKRFVAEAVTYSFGTNGYHQAITLGNRIKYGGDDD